MCTTGWCSCCGGGGACDDFAHFSIIEGLATVFVGLSDFLFRLATCVGGADASLTEYILKWRKNLFFKVSKPRMG